MSACVRCKVSGRVQGVWFRAATRERARALGVRGWARNLSDGSVDVLACGTEQAVDSLRDWLWDGPPHAVVTGVNCEAVTVDEPDGFTTS